MQVSLVMFKADGTRREFHITRSRFVLGRKNDCDLRIPLSSVSREHCEISLDDGNIVLRDLGSSNGTYHNTVRVQETQLSPGDEIVIGPVVFTVLVDGEPQEVQPVRTMIGEEESASPHADGATRRIRPEEPPSAGRSDVSEASTEDLDALPMLELEEDDSLAAFEHLAEQNDEEDDDVFPFPDDDEEVR